MLADLGKLNPRAYYDTAWAGLEERAVFRGNWIFVGLTDDYAAPGDYATFSIGGIALLVRRGEHRMHAFQNVCSHRHSVILRCKRGAGDLRCGYHGWTYDDEGTPVGLPGNRTNFGLSDDEKSALRLRGYPVESVGRFLFVRISDSGPSVEDYLGPATCQLLHRISDGCAPAFARGIEHWNANWKLAVENTLEPYHATFVHGDSLAQKIDVSQHSADLSTIHTTSTHPLAAADAAWWTRVRRLTGWSPFWDVEYYIHAFIFPNLCIAVHRGTLASIQVFYPVSPTHCDLEFRQLVAKGDVGSGQSHWRNAFEHEMQCFNTRILSEDRGVVEDCQRGVGQARGNALLARCECRVTEFQKVVSDHVISSRSGDSVGDQPI